MMVLFIVMELFTCRNTVTNSIDSVSYHRHPRAYIHATLSVPEVKRAETTAGLGVNFYFLSPPSFTPVPDTSTH